MAAPDHQRQAGLLRRLDLLGVPHHLHRQQGQRLFEGAELGGFPQRGDLRFLPHPLHPAGYLLHPAAGLLHCKPGSEPPEKAADRRRHLHLRHVPAVHRDDVRCPGHQPHGRVRPRQPELQQPHSQLQRHLLHVPVHSGVRCGRLREDLPLRQ